jgi:hypothetical protein
VLLVGFVSEKELAGTIPVFPFDVDEDEVSDDNRSIAEEAAPMAKNMTRKSPWAQAGRQVSPTQEQVACRTRSY